MRHALAGFIVLATVAAAAPPAQGELVLQKEGTKLYHRPGCLVVRDGQGVLALTRAQAESRGLTPHDDCDPAKAAPGAAQEDKFARPAAPVFVLIDESKYYHRDSCRKLKGQSKRAGLESAGRTRWPCPACKPPIRKRPARAVPLGVLS